MKKLALCLIFLPVLSSFANDCKELSNFYVDAKDKAALRIRVDVTGKTFIFQSLTRNGVNSVMLESGIINKDGLSVNCLGDNSISLTLRNSEGQIAAQTIYSVNSDDLLTEELISQGDRKIVRSFKKMSSLE